MNRVLLVNHQKEACGVYQYAKRLYDTLSDDVRVEYHILETEGPVELFESISNLNPDFIIYNYNPITMNWFNADMANSISAKQIYLYHDGTLPEYFKHNAFLMVDMTEDREQNKFSVPRPMPKPILLESKTNPIFTVGSFGLALEHKGFIELCFRVQEQYDEAIIRLHLTESYFCDQNGNTLQSIIERCKSIIFKPGVKLEISTEFTTDDSILSFLNQNDINVFNYDPLPGVGLSSVVDYLPVSGRPFAVNSSYMFRHINSLFPELNWDSNSLEEIISYGTRSGEELSKLWSYQNVRDKIYEVLELI